MQVAYLGPRGSFTHQVAQQVFPTADLQALRRLQRLSRPTKRGSYLFRYSSRKLD